MKEIKILYELEIESISGMWDGNDHIKKLVIELLCENNNINIDYFYETYDKLLLTPLKKYKFTCDWRIDFENMKDIIDLAFYRLNDILKEPTAESRL